MSVKTELSKSNINENLLAAIQELHKNVKENSAENTLASSVPKETKSKYTSYNKSSCYNKNMKFPHSKKKFVPVSSCLTNASTKVVLSERNVEIKDLESKVKFLKIKIKELENENKTLQSVQSRQERELKKFKEGVTDIPALLKSHKEEIKAYESTISNIRKELRDCQKELKLRNESLLKKDNHIDKLNVNLKQNERLIHEFSSEIKVLKVAKKDLEEENKILIVANENLKNENDDLCKQIKDMTLKTQNLEENLNKANDLNENLQNELDELKGKFENGLLQVLNDENIQSCEDQIHCETDDVSSKAFTKNSSVDCVENEIGKLENSVIGDASEQNLHNVKSVDKTKDALIHTFKSYEDFCNSQLKNSGARLSEIGSNNIKLLPPLKTPFNESSTSIISDFGKRECFSSAADMNFTDKVKYSQNRISTKDFKKKCIFTDCEINTFESKTNTSCDSIINGKSSFLYLSLNDRSKDWQNCKFKKDIQSIKRTDTNEMKMSENSSFISKGITEREKCGDLSKALKIHDNLFRENLKENAQSILEYNNTPIKNLEKEKYKYIEGSSKNMSKCWEITANGKDFECKTNTDKYEADHPKHRRTFLKQNMHTKPLTCFHFDESSEKKPSETQYDLSWLNNL